MDVENVTDELLIQNSILAFIHNYREHTWVDKYQELLNKIESGKLKISEVRKRGRSAQRQKQEKSSKDTAS
tara:strand:+ start:381 stop:593 length:213 start_codon:yes stop_codon:yes gene_type:complete